MARGKFFAIGKPQWEAACRHGVRHAAVLLVMACGTGRDNATTKWSALAVFRYAGVEWRRAKVAIADLVKAGVLEQTRGGTSPLYRISRPEIDDESMIWLPNSLVTGAANEEPPVKRLRETQDIDFIQALVELYAVHDLPGDGGLPRSLVRAPFKKGVRICDRGHHRIFGFNKAEEALCVPDGPLARFKGRRGDGKRARSWEFLTTMERMGLLQRVDYLAESDALDAELIHALSGDAHGQAVVLAIWEVVDRLPDGYRHAASKFDYAIPVPQHMPKAAVVGVYRLTYRPRTSRTTTWYASHGEACERKADEYLLLAGR